MRKSLNEPISVVYYYDHRHQRVRPYLMNWQNQEWRLGPIDFHHKTRDGGALVHHFSLCDQDKNAYFKIALDTESLHWELEEFMLGTDMEVHYDGQGS